MTANEPGSSPDSTDGPDSPLRGREIVYDDPALVALLEHKDLPRFDARLSALEWGLWLDAEDFPLVDGFERLRVARLPGREGESTLRVFFEIESDDVVLIRAIEPVESG